MDSHYFWAAMAELTPSTMDVLFRPNDGLRKLQDQVARNVTSWYRDLWWKSTSMVAVDFFHSTDIIDVAIDASLKRVLCSNHPTLTTEVTVTATNSPSTTTIQLPVIEERADRRRFYQGPRALDLVETTLDPVVTSGTTKAPRLAARRRRLKNVTAIIPPNISDASSS